jgi:carbon starvation protein
VVLLTAAVIGGRFVQNDPALASWFTFGNETLALMLCGYGFLASVLPVWLLLSPRDYLSSIMKLSVIAMLAGGVICVAPTLQMPATTEFIHGGGPLLKGSGTLFPYLFITIACGAVSGFHSLVSSGTTPKMIMREGHIKFIAVGSMLAEGLVSVLALVAACSLAPADYFMINVAPANVPHVLRTQMPPAGSADASKELADRLAALRVLPEDKDYGKYMATANQPAPPFVAVVKQISLAPSNIERLTREVEERVVGRPGGAVSLAVGMAQIFSKIPGMSKLMSYWYHFAIMFEALFILTTIDAGTRIARFILQEALGKAHGPLARTDYLPANLLTSALVVAAWGYFLYTGGIETIWPMFGAANQLLAGVALVIGTSFIINRGRARYSWVTIVPMAFVLTTTLCAGWANITGIYWPLITGAPETHLQGVINLVLTALIMIAAVVVLLDALPKWFRAAGGKPVYVEPQTL